LILFQFYTERIDPSGGRREPPDGGSLGEYPSRCSSRLCDRAGRNPRPARSKTPGHPEPSFTTMFGLHLMLKPYATLLLSEDTTYPGLVTAVGEHFAEVIWYKWGYDAPDTIHAAVLLAKAETQLITEAECIRRFRAVPPQYTASA